MLLGLPLATLAPAPWKHAGLLLLVALALMLFAGVTLRLQYQRKRKLQDVTLDFWRLGMACLILSVPLAVTHALIGLPDAWVLFAGLLFLFGFAVSVVNGMLYKILPFMAWFHLQASVGFKPGQPSMRDYLPETRARKQYHLHLAALACLLATPFLSALAIPGGLLLAAAAGALGWNPLQTWLRYRQAGAAGR